MTRSSSPLLAAATTSDAPAVRAEPGEEQRLQDLIRESSCPDELRAILDAKDAEIASLRASLEAAQRERDRAQQVLAIIHGSQCVCLSCESLSRRRAYRSPEARQ